MDTKLKAKPDGYHTATPYLIVANAARALEFYREAFGAEEVLRLPGPDGKVGHAEIRIGDSRIMLADEFPDMGRSGPHTLGGSPISLLLYVENADAVTECAVRAGAEVLRPIQNQFYGDRSAMVRDPFGHTWMIATHVEDVSPEELQRRSAALLAQEKR